MLTATLGGLIKDYRLKKRLSQQEVSLRIGWSDSTRLSKIEQGRVGKPTRVTIEKVIKALDLNKQEKGEFLLVGGYLPTETEIQGMIKKMAKRIDNWSYPATLTDYAWRSLYTNNEILKVFGVPVSFKNMDPKDRINILEIPFLPQEMLGSTASKGDFQKSTVSFKVGMVSDFKSEHQGMENEDWYKKLIKKMMGNKDFRTIWNQVDVKDLYKELSNYEYKEIQTSDNPPKIKKYHEFCSQVIEDPRFKVLLYLPAE